MNLKKLEYVNEFLIEQMNHWILFPIALAIMGFSRQAEDFYAKPDFLAWIFCSLFPLAFFFQRSKIKKFRNLLPAHIGTALLSFMIPVQNHITGRVICVGCAVMYVIFSLGCYLKKNTAFSSPIQLPVAILIACCSFLFQRDAFQGTGNWRNYCILPLIFSFGLFFVIMFIKRYMDFLNVNKSSAGYLPDNEIFHSGLGLAGIYTFFGILVMIFVTYLPWVKVVCDWVMKGIKAFLRWLFQKLPKSSETGEALSGEESFQFSGGLSLSEGRQTFWLWEVLQYLAVAALLLGLIVLLVKMLAKLIAYIQNHLLLRKTVNMEQADEVFDVREKCVFPMRTAQRRQRQRGPLSYGDKIRKLYKKKLLSSKEQMSEQDRRKLGIYTAREWEERLSADGMAAVYELARYSGQEMSAEDVKLMKEACRQEQT